MIAVLINLAGVVRKRLEVLKTQLVEPWTEEAQPKESVMMAALIPCTMLKKGAL